MNRGTIKIKGIIFGVVFLVIFLSLWLSGCVFNPNQSPWPRFQGNQKGTGKSILLGPLTDSVQWRFKING